MLLLEKPSLDHFWVFGARGFVHVDKSKRTKWDKKVHRCIFLGYADGSKAYRVWNVENDCLVISRTIALDERPSSAYKELPPASDERTVLVSFPNDEPVVSGIRGPGDDATPMEVDEELENQVTESMEVDDGVSAPRTIVPLYTRLSNPSTRVSTPKGRSNVHHLQDRAQRDLDAQERLITVSNTAHRGQPLTGVTGHF